MYKATNALYKTSLGNDTFTEYIVEIEATSGENDTVKIEDVNEILPENTSVLAGKGDENSSEYKKAAEAMKKIVDNFQVFSLELIDGNVEKVVPSGRVKLMFRADDYFDRTKVKVYFMDENGMLAEVIANGNGRYVSVETDKTGTFIVCVPGVAFVMPMWGYLLIAVSGLAIISVAIIVPVVLVKRKRKK